MPGISVAPAPSITTASAPEIAALPRPTWRMRLPCTSTLPLNGCVPLPSRMRTFVNSVLAMMFLLQAAQRVVAWAARTGGARWNSPSFITARMRALSCRMVMSASGSPSTSSMSARQPSRM